MRQGEMVATRQTAETTPRGAGRADGRPQGAAARREGARRSPARRCCEVEQPRRSTTTAACALVDDVSFDVRAGEIVGIAGVAGNGQTELLEALAGIRRPTAGEHRARRRARSTRPAPPTRGDARRSASRTCPRTATRGPGAWPSRHARTPILGYHDEPRYRNGPLRSTLGAIARHCAELDASATTSARATPRLKTRELLRRQPAEDRARARDGARPRACCSSASRRAASTSAPSSSSTAQLIAHARRAARRCCWSRSSSTRSCRSSDRILVMFAGRIVGEVAGRRPTSASSA